MYFEYSINSLNMVTLTAQFLVVALPFPLGRVACTALEFLVIHDGLHRVYGGVGMALFRSEIAQLLQECDKPWLAEKICFSVQSPSKSLFPGY